MAVIELVVSFGDQGSYFGREIVAAFGVSVVRVERRARGRQQHDVARLRRARPPLAPHRASSSQSSRLGPGVVANAATTSGAASPNATTPRRRARLASSSTDRSRPLLRPPASSTTESNDSTPRAASRRGSSPSNRRTSAPHQLRRPARRGGAWSCTSTTSRELLRSSRQPPTRPRPTPARLCDRATAHARIVGERRKFASVGTCQAFGGHIACIPSRAVVRRRTRCAARRCCRDRARVGVVGVEHERVGCGLMFRDARFGRRRSARTSRASRDGRARSRAAPRPRG